MRLLPNSHQRVSARVGATNLPKVFSSFRSDQAIFLEETVDLDHKSASAGAIHKTSKTQLRFLRVRYC